MKLYFSINSPYARKCRVVALEKGLGNVVDFVSVSPMENPPELLAANPLATVPALMSDEGIMLCESPVICEYLDSRTPTPPLFPAGGKARFQVLALAALADGVMDAAVACVLEARRPEDKRSMEWVIRKESAIRRTIADIALAVAANGALSIGTINAAVALAYVNFRLPSLGWKEQYPALAQWLAEFEQRPSMQATMPQA